MDHKMTIADRKLKEYTQRESLILEAARSVLAVEDVAGLTIDRIALAIAYSRATVYQHFKSKEDIILALAAQNLHLQAALLEHAAGFQGNSREKIYALGLASGLILPSHLRMELILQTSPLRIKASERWRRELAEAEERCLAPTVTSIHQACLDGDFSLPGDMSAEELVFAFWSMTFGSFVVMNSEKPLANLKVEKPMHSIMITLQAALDGLGWRPLSHEWDYDASISRIKNELLMDEKVMEILGQAKEKFQERRKLYLSGA
jgi:AcrR family transcriptional regulator